MRSSPRALAWMSGRNWTVSLKTLFSFEKLGEPQSRLLRHCMGFLWQILNLAWQLTWKHFRRLFIANILHITYNL